MKIKTILFDLDDTLLGNDMETFLPSYFKLLGHYAASHLNEERFLPAVLKASELMTHNTDPAVTNRDVLWQEIEQLTGLDPENSQALLDDFYRREFNQLQPLTQSYPVAAELLRACFAQGLKVVIATNPMFPLRAIEARLAWAGVPVTEFPFELVTSIENMHATKPHQAYYMEILQKVNSQPHETLMVGDDWQRDIEPAAALGLFTYWIQLPGTSPAAETLPTAYGSLAGLLARVQSDWLRQPAGLV